MIEANYKGSYQSARQACKWLGLDGNAHQRLNLSGDTPLLASSFHVGVAAQSTIACAALAASEVYHYRTGEARVVSVDMHDAEAECTGLFTLDGKTPQSWAPLSGLYPCRDGHVRIHANFDHHRDGALQLLGLPGRATKAEVSQALAQWNRIEFESRAAAQGLVVAAARSFEEWDQTAQAQASKDSSLLHIEQIGDAPAGLLTDSCKRPLDGVRVLDLTRILAGPICGRTLASFGADVMLVNAPGLPNIESIVETSRGKLSVHLDLKQPNDAERLRHLVSNSQVFIQGYRPGAMAGLGFSPEAVAQINPGIVYVSLCAYGDGPWADRRGFDSLVQTATGFNQAEADAAGSATPRAMPVQILDCASGFLMAAAAQAALLKQLSVGGSWHVRVSLAQTAAWLRGLGRVENGFNRETPDLESRLESFGCSQGELRAMPAATRIEGIPIGWQRPAVPPGTNPPAWPAGL